MRKRTLAREIVLKSLYQADIRAEALSPVAEDFFQSLSIEDPAEVLSFARMLISGIEKNLPEIDIKITKHAVNWQFDRMAVIDRNVLRLGIFELLYCPDIPAKVTINEAIELAKKFGDVESGKFVNGILDKIHKINPKKSDKK